MLTLLASGRLVRDPRRGQSKNGNGYTTALIAVPLRKVSETDADNVLVSCIAFGEVGDSLAALKTGDSVSLSGDGRPSSWTDKHGKECHGLSVTAARVMSLAKPQSDSPDEPDDEPVALDDPF